jgi:ribA/ribD-fused uncharacterized protein
VKSPTIEISKKHESKIYKANESCVFRKTKELYGGLSNMASGYPISINGITILSTEALYQACRFPHLPEVQEKIINEKSPMTSKMVSKPYRDNSRTDWDETRIRIMRWCLRIKLAQNFAEFGKLLESTFDKPIVEESTKDKFWGTIREKENENILTGVNALGRLLMELRAFYKQHRYSHDMFVIKPLDISNFKLFGHKIQEVDERDKFISYIKKNMRFEEKEDFNHLTSVEYKFAVSKFKHIKKSFNHFKVDHHSFSKNLDKSTFIFIKKSEEKTSLPFE